jgi:hypothetical protein
VVLPTPAAAPGQGVFPLEEANEPTPDANEPLVDSFGDPIKPEDLALENQGAAIPQFARGSLVSPTSVASAPSNDPPMTADAGIAPPVESMTPAPAPAASQNTPLTALQNIVKDAGQAIQAQPTTKRAPTVSASGLPVPVIIIMHLVIASLIGLAVFFLWHSQYKTIGVLNGENQKLIGDINGHTQTIASLQNELTLVQKKAADIPIFISSDASYSFYRNIPDLRMTLLDNGNGAVLEYGEVVDGMPLSGFTLTIEGKQANGIGLEQIVDQEMALQVAGATRVDKNAENNGDKIGFSYLERNNEGGKVVYFFRNSTWATFYVRLEFAQAWKTQAELNDYNEIIGLIMSSLKIYKN